MARDSARGRGHGRSRRRRRRAWLRRHRSTLEVAAGVLIGVVLVAVAWQVYATQRDLARAERAVHALVRALEDDDRAARDRALGELAEAAGSARDRADGATLAALAHLPVLGDDVAGLQALSRSVDAVAGDAAAPLVAVVDLLPGLVGDGRVDLERAHRLEAPVADAAAALAAADQELAGHDPAGYVGPLQRRFEDYATLVGGLARGLGTAEQAVAVLPSMVGEDGPRNYLLVVQNNAEVRATGGMPGSWARIHADGGRLEMREQAGVGVWPVRSRPVVPITRQERAVYGPLLGTYFQDAGFTRDFPRAAQLWRGHWRRAAPDVPLDGVVAVDPVALSYLLDGLGPLRVGGERATPDTLVPLLLSQVYRDLSPEGQDAVFEEAARAVFDELTHDIDSVVPVAVGLARAVDEGRLMVAPFRKADRRALEGAAVLGALSRDDGTVPHVDVGLNDGTASKMSYYLRSRVEVEAEWCDNGTQRLAGRLLLSQSLPADDAAALPLYVTGAGRFDVEPGTQLVQAHVYGPWRGSILDVEVDGEPVAAPVRRLHGRPVLTVGVEVDSTEPVEVAWRMDTGPAQSADGRVGITPGVAADQGPTTFASAC